MLTVLRREYTFAQVACVQTRLQEPFDFTCVLCKKRTSRICDYVRFFMPFCISYVTLNIFFKKLFTNPGKFKTTTFIARHSFYSFQKKLLFIRQKHRKRRSTHSSTAITVGGRKKAIKTPATKPDIMHTKSVLPSLCKNILNPPPPHFPHFTPHSVLSLYYMCVGRIALLSA